MTDITPSPAQAASPPAPQAATPADEAAPSRATFDILPLSREVRETLAEIGYTHPTPVQIAVWEPATRGKDAVVQARTGTGKTAAFGLPIVDHLVRRSMPHVQVLALCPTRELALQVGSEVERLGKKRNVKVTAVYGGAPMQRQIDQLAEGAQVVVGTPGRVLDHLRRGTLDPRHIRMLVLDEADEMLSMGFEREVTAILDTLPKDRQTLLFSATVPPDIERMAKKLRSPEYLTLSGDHIGALEIEHFVYMVASDKLAALVKVIEVENPESAVVFCNTKDETERVAQALSRQGFDADWLNGDLPQSDREKVMAATREGRLRFLVATDVAARGIDISHLTHVINHDFPQDAESYVHRTGRTGRAGRTGTAVSLITPHDVGGLYLLRLTYKIRPIERQIPTEGELKTRAEADLVTMLIEAFVPGPEGGRSRTPPIHPDDLALARRLLTHEQCDLIFAGLLRDHLGARPTAKEEASATRRATRVPRPPKPPARQVAMGETPKPPAQPVAAPEAAKPVVAAPRPPAPAPAAHAETAPRAVPAMAPVAAHTPAPAPQRPAAPAQPVAVRAAPAEATPFAGHTHPPEPPRPPAQPVAGHTHAPETPKPSPQAIVADELPRPERRPDERRGRDDRRDRERRGPRPDSLGPRRPRRDDHVPVSAAEGTHEGDPQKVPQRHSDFSTWQPPEEEGDDEPILGTEAEEPAPRGPRRFDRGGRGDRDRRPPFPVHDAARAAAEPTPRAPVTMGETPKPPPQAIAGAATSAPAPSSDAVPEAENEADFAEIYVNVGRRDGARAADFQQILTDRAGLMRAHVRRIRVRERNAFVSVRRDDLARALAALNGASVAGKVAMAEQARDRAGEGEGGAEGAPVLGEAQQAPSRPSGESLATAEPQGPPQEARIFEPALPAEVTPPIVEEAASEPVTADDSVPTGRSGA